MNSGGTDGGRSISSEIALPSIAAVGHAAYSRQQIVDAHYLQPRGTRPEEVAQPAHDFGSALRLRQDLAG